MNIEIRKLSTDLLDDWLYYFDNVAFSDNSGWSGCYCMHYHWSSELEDEWKRTGKVDNRSYGAKFVNEGIIQGYLAYLDGNVAGWCNTNDKQGYNTVLSKIHWNDTEKNKKIKSIVCFNIAPTVRRKGIASLLLDRVCSDAFNDGYEYVEAYPFINGVNRDYHGPISLYEKNGFTICHVLDDCTVVRKYF